MISPIRNQRPPYKLPSNIIFKTVPGGSVKVQVMDRKYQPLPGRSFDDCDWLVGDHLDRKVTWKGEADLGHQGEGPISLGFQIRCGELYSVEFKNPD